MEGRQRAPHLVRVLTSDGDEAVLHVCRLWWAGADEGGDEWTSSRQQLVTFSYVL